MDGALGRGNRCVVARSPDKTFAAALRALRQDRGLTQEGLAHSAGVSMVTLARIETGVTDPRWTTIVELAAALDISMSELGTRIDQIRRSA